MNGECRMKIQIFNRLIRHGESFRAPRSVQESIPVRKIYRDGVWLCGGRYSKMWRFQDVNYAVASEADQSEILMRYCSVINAWPDDAYVQVLTNNRRIDPVEFENTMLMRLRGDDMDRLREEYNQIVRERTEWSNNHNFSAEPPYEMQQMRQEMKALLDDLTSRDQRMVLVLVTLVHLADSYAQLNSDTEAITATARGDLCRFNTLHFQQEEGLNTALPYGLREIEAMRTMNTESAAALTPFSVQDVMDRGGIYYGRNAISRNSIICNRKLLLNGNGFYLGVPGSGKSMAAKWELMNVILSTDDDVLMMERLTRCTPTVPASVLRPASRCSRGRSSAMWAVRGTVRVTICILRFGRMEREWMLWIYLAKLSYFVEVFLD